MKMTLKLLFIIVLVSNLFSNLVFSQENEIIVGYRIEAETNDSSINSEIIPNGLLPNLTYALGRDIYSYRTTKSLDDFLLTHTPTHNYSTTYSKEFVFLESKNMNWHLELTLNGLGYGDNTSNIKRVEPEGVNNKIEYKMNYLTEWYINSPLGLQQGFTLNKPPMDNLEGEDLVIKINFNGNLTPKLVNTRKGIHWYDGKGDKIIAYDGLYAYDSRGNELASYMTVSDSIINIHIDDRNASYPIIVDPVITEINKLIASDAQPEDSFGWSVSIDGDTAIVGAYQKNTSSGSEQAGSAYIFERNFGGTNNWGEVKKLTNSDSMPGDMFGYSVSISGNKAIVGAIGKNNFTGSAYIFERNIGGLDNWEQVKKLSPSDASPLDQFGISVSISARTAIVGALSNSLSPIQKSSAYIFDQFQGGLGNWGEVKKLTSSAVSTDDSFGISVSVSGVTAIVGAPLSDDLANNSGSAYIFMKNLGGQNNWGEVKKLTASDATSNDEFGHSVSISGNTAIVGAHNKQSAYIFEKHFGGGNNWGEIKKLTSLDEGFGYSVSISNDRAVVGAHLNSQSGSISGSSYFYARDLDGPNKWGQLAEFKTSEEKSNDQFGYSVSNSGDTGIVGAPISIEAGIDSGSAYLFQYMHVCGNNTLEYPEECDDGEFNGDITSCCTDTCELKLPRTTCDDNDECTIGDECNYEGICSGDATRCTMNYPGDGAGHGDSLIYVNNETNGTFKDKRTQLVWEKKVGTPDNEKGTICDKLTNIKPPCDNPHDVNNTYQWSLNLDDPNGSLFTLFLEQLNNGCDKQPTISCDNDSDCSAVGGKCGFAGYRDWCIPNAKQLQGIVNYGTRNPSTSIHGSTRSGAYWSGTQLYDTPSKAWHVSFNIGTVKNDLKSAKTMGARAVRPCEVSCKPMDIENGTVACDDRNVCKVTCDEGFVQFTGNPLCVNGVFDSIPVCKRSCSSTENCLVFVTKGNYVGSHLSSMFHENAIPNECQKQAALAGIQGVFKPWLTGVGQGLNSEFTKSDTPYTRVDGVKIADNWADLIQCEGIGSSFECLDASIDLDQFGDPVDANIWTGTTENATIGLNCENWSDGIHQATIGRSTESTRSWTNTSSDACALAKRIYCFEQ